MRLIAPILILLAAATPGSAQVCLGGPSASETVTIGASFDRALEARGNAWGVEFAALGDQGINVAAGIAWTGYGYPVAAQIGYAPKLQGIQLCPVVRLETKTVAKRNGQIAAGLGVGSMVTSALGLFARGEFGKASLADFREWTGSASLGAALYLSRVNVVLSARGDMEHVSETAELRIRLRIDIQ